MSRFSNILKADESDLEPAQFEELDPKAARVIRAGRRAGQPASSTTVPPLARNVIRKDIADLKAGPVEISEPLLPPEPESVPASTPGPAAAETEEPFRDIERTLRESLRAEWEADWVERLDAAVENARSEGFDQGYAAAKMAHEEALETTREEYRAGLSRLRETWSSFINRSETLLLEIALEIAQFLVDAPLPERFSKRTEEALIEALEALSHDVPVRLSLNPVEMLRLQDSGMARFIEEQFPTLRWDPQATLKEGNWIVQTPRQAIRRVSDELLDNLRDRFGLTENTPVEEDIESSETFQQDQHIPPVTHVSVTTTTFPPPFEQSTDGLILTNPGIVTTTAIDPSDPDG